MYTILQQRFPNRDYFWKSRTLKRISGTIRGCVRGWRGNYLHRWLHRDGPFFHFFLFTYIETLIPSSYLFRILYIYGKLQIKTITRRICTLCYISLWHKLWQVLCDSDFSIYLRFCAENVKGRGRPNCVTA